MGVRSSNINRGPNNRSDGHLLNYIRNTFARGGGAISISARFYSVTPSTTSLNEGSSVTFTVNTANIPDGTTLYWTLNTVSGTINASDFSGGATSGSFTVTNGTGSVALTLANDVTTEGSESFQLQVRTDSTSGTIVATSSTVTINDTSVAYIIATAPGATTIDSGGFRTHIWTGPGSFVVSDIGATGLVEYLVVAGGGGGGRTFDACNEGAGGGGAGGFRTGTSFPVTVTTYPITVGGGGVSHANGNPSIFSTITSTAGGRGGGTGPSGTGPSPVDATGQPGGSGGGAMRFYGVDAPGSGNTPPTSPPQGNNGGGVPASAPTAGLTGGGGGGGAGAAGSNGPIGPSIPTTSGGAGGIGSPITWIPASYGTPGPAPGRYFAGGGGGGGGGLAGPGGSGGGGNGGAGLRAPGSPGTVNTGGGGGGAAYNSPDGGDPTGGSGGSGIVAIRYPIS